MCKDYVIGREITTLLKIAVDNILSLSIDVITYFTVIQTGIHINNISTLLTSVCTKTMAKKRWSLSDIPLFFDLQTTFRYTFPSSYLPAGCMQCLALAIPEFFRKTRTSIFWQLIYCNVYSPKVVETFYKNTHLGPYVNLYSPEAAVINLVSQFSR